MFKFLRKNRKIILIVISFVIILSFSFFGTYNAIIDSKEKVKDKKVFETKKEKVFRSDLNILSFLLERENRILKENSTIYKEFFQTKIIKLLFEKNLKKLSSDFEKRLMKIKNFDLYVHPYNPNISLENILRKKNPKILRLLDEIKKRERFDLNTLEIFSDLYIEINKISKIELQNELLLEQKNISYIPVDRNLFDVNFHLFPFSNLSEWLGDDFLDIIYKFIFDVVGYFEGKKEFIKKEEVQLELLKFYPESNRKLIKIWKKVLQFKKYMRKNEEDLFLDSFCFKNFSSYSDKKVKLKFFELPKYLTFKDFYDFLKLLLYLEITSDEKDIYFSEKYKKIEEIEKRYPSLIETHFLVEMKKTDMDEIGTKISEKRLWKWQVDEENYNKLKDKFYVLSSFERDTKEKRFNALENISYNKRKEIDEYTRKEIVKEDKEIIKKVLSEKEKEKKEIFIRMVDNFPSLEGISNKHLIELFNNKNKNLFICSDDEEIYYQIECLSAENKSIISFKKGLEDRTLENILNDLLYSFYNDLEKNDFNVEKLFLNLTKEPFNKVLDFLKNNRNKRFEEIKEKVGIIYFSNILGKIDEEIFSFFKKQSFDEEKSLLLSFLYSNMNKIKDDLINKNVEEKKLLEDKNQWKLEIFDREMTRINKEDSFESYVYKIFGDLIFEEKIMKDNYSGINLDKDPFSDKIFFFKFLEKQKPNKVAFNNINDAKEVILNESKYRLAEDLLKNLLKNDEIIH